MGIGLGRKYARCSVYDDLSQTVAPNPDPLNFRILSLTQFGNHVVAEIEYPNCTNFEGVKVCVFANTTCAEVRSRGEIDPHFSEAGTGPIARFEPTCRGVKLAETLAKSMGEEL